MITNVINFCEINMLKDIFLEAKKLRHHRYPAHVLVVEDDDLTRRIVVGALGEDNAMITGENAKDAIGSYLLHAPDIVFLDIGLPDMDGLSVLDQIIAVDPDAYIVMLSSHNDMQTVNRAYDAGAKGFVSKPFKKEDLQAYIRSSATYHHKSCM